MDDTSYTSVDDRYASALAQAVSRLHSKLIEIERSWKNCVLEAFGYLEETAKKKLEAQDAQAAKLYLEMQKDLFDFMPYFANVSDPNKFSEVNPQEPRRVKEQIYDAAKFIEWLLFRKYGASPEEIARLFNWQELDQLTKIYCGLLRTLAQNTQEILSPDSLPILSSSTTGDEQASTSVPYLSVVS